MENNVSKYLGTWLPLDVYESFNAFAKQYARTGLDKFDYGVAIRILLMKSMYADMVYSLNERISKLEALQQPTQSLSQIPEGYREVRTMGDKKKEVN